MADAELKSPHAELRSPQEQCLNPSSVQTEEDSNSAAHSVSDREASTCRDRGLSRLHRVSNSTPDIKKLSKLQCLTPVVAEGNSEN